MSVDEVTRAAASEVLAGVELADAARRYGLAPDVISRALEDNDEPIQARTLWDAPDLMSARFGDVRYTVDRILPSGLAMVAAQPKVGKTRLVVQLAVAVSAGLPVIGLATTQTEVFVLALEDGARRMRAMLASNPDHRCIPPGWLTITTAARPFSDEDGGLDDLRRWLQRHPHAFVVVDVLERVRPTRRRSSNAYRADYGDVQPIQALANRHDATILLVHHTNQQVDVADPFMRFSGSNGLTGAVDALLLLERRRGDDLGMLTVVGREVEDASLVLGFERGWWSPTTMPTQGMALPRETRALWLWLIDNEGATTAELAKQYGRTENATLQMLKRLEDADLVDRLDGYERPRPGEPVRWCAAQRVGAYPA